MISLHFNISHRLCLRVKGWWSLLLLLATKLLISILATSYIVSSLRKNLTLDKVRMESSISSTTIMPSSTTTTNIVMLCLNLLILRINNIEESLKCARFEETLGFESSWRYPSYYTSLIMRWVKNLQLNKNIDEYRSQVQMN